jgi:Dienelactone hydrolase family
MKEDSKDKVHPFEGNEMNRRGFVKQMGLLAGTALFLNYAAPYVLASAGDRSNPAARVNQEGGPDSIVEEVGQFDCMNRGVNYFIARPAKGTSFATVYLVHEVFGVTENVRNLARDLAKQGKLVFVPDCLPAVDVETDEAEVVSLSEMDKLNAGLAFLVNRSDVDASRIEGVGTCWDKSREASRSAYALAHGNARVAFKVKYYDCGFPFNRMGALS